MSRIWALLAAAIAAGFAYWLYWRWSHRRMLQLARLIPGPPALPILGNALIFMAKPEEQLSIIAGFFHKYGQYVKFWLGPDLNVCVKNPADIRLLLTSNKINHKGPLYEFLKAFIGPGILTGGPTWRNHRKIANPSYNKKSIECYSEIFNKEAESLAKTLCNKDPKVTFDVYTDVVDCTTQCVCQTLMGLSKSDSETVKNMDEVVRVTQTLYTFMFDKMTKWWLHIPIIYWITGRSKQERQYLKMLDEMISDIVSKRRKALKTSSIDDDAIGIVDRYLMSGELTDQEIKWETFSLFTTSQEASAKIASTVLLFLAHLPDWQERVYNEIIDVLGPNDDHVTEEQLRKLQNLDMVYKEALRYMSIAAFIQRTVDEEITINNGELTLPVGASVVIPIHEVHRDPQNWDDPYKVNPDRFSASNVKKRDPNAYIPFSLGAMDCLGRVYATSLIKTLIVRVLRRVRFEADGAVEDLELHFAISVRFAKGYNLRARQREKHGVKMLRSKIFDIHS